jgi:hypothetical protein
VFEKDMRGGGFYCQKVNGPFDDKRDEELQEINHKEAHKPKDKGPAVPEKVLLKGQEILECFGERQGGSFHNRV